MTSKFFGWDYMNKKVAKRVEIRDVSTTVIHVEWTCMICAKIVWPGQQQESSKQPEDDKLIQPPTFFPFSSLPWLYIYFCQLSLTFPPPGHGFGKPNSLLHASFFSSSSSFHPSTVQPKFTATFTLVFFSLIIANIIQSLVSIKEKPTFKMSCHSRYKSCTFTWWRRSQCSGRSF